MSRNRTLIPFRYLNPTLILKIFQLTIISICLNHAIQIYHQVWKVNATHIPETEAISYYFSEQFFAFLQYQSMFMCSYVLDSFRIFLCWNECVRPVVPIQQLKFQNPKYYFSKIIFEFLKFFRNSLMKTSLKIDSTCKLEIKQLTALKNEEIVDDLSHLGRLYWTTLTLLYHVKDRC